MPSRIAGILFIWLAAAAWPAAQKSTLEDILARAAEHHSSFRIRASGMTLDESYTLTQTTAGRMLTPLRFQSDVVLINTSDRLVGLRDPYTLDNAPLRERKPRIVDILKEPTSLAWDRAQRFAQESHFRFIHEIVLALNDPMLAVQYVSPEMQSKATFKHEGMKKVDGLEVASINFKERAGRDIRYSLGTPGNATASGRLFIDPSSGAIVKSELWANSATEAVVSTVTYARHAETGLWFPAKMMQTFDWKELDDVRSNRDVGAYGARLAFQGNATYTPGTLTPIDLSKMTR